MNLDQNIDINLNKSIENDIGNKNTSNLNKSASDIPANSPMNNLKVEENKDNTDTTIKVKAHTDLLHVIEDCIVIIQKEKTQETKRNEASGAVYNLLLSYVKKIKQTSILERCLLKAFSFVEELQLSQVFEKQKIKGNCRPQVIMKLFDKALRALQTISQDKGSLDHVKIAELELREMIINTYLKFYVAVYFANENKSVSSDAFYSTY